MGLYSKGKDNIKTAYPPFLNGDGEIIVELVKASNKEGKLETRTFFQVKVVGMAPGTLGEHKVIGGDLVTEELYMDKVYSFGADPSATAYPDQGKDEAAKLLTILLSIAGLPVNAENPETITGLGLKPEDYDLNTNKGKGALADDVDAKIDDLFKRAVLTGEGKAFAGARIHLTMRSKANKAKDRYFTNFTGIEPAPPKEVWEAFKTEARREGWTFSGDAVAE